MNHHRIKTDQTVSLHDHAAHDTADYTNKEAAADRTEHLKQQLESLQELLYAGGERAVLVVL